VQAEGEWVWYRYDGNPVAAATDNKGGEENMNMSRKTLRILKSPLYAVRRQTVLRSQCLQKSAKSFSKFPFSCFCFFIKW